MGINIFTQHAIERFETVCAGHRSGRVVAGLTPLPNQRVRPDSARPHPCQWPVTGPQAPVPAPKQEQERQLQQVEANSSCRRRAGGTTCRRPSGERQPSGQGGCAGEASPGELGWARQPWELHPQQEQQRVQPRQRHFRGQRAHGADGHGDHGQSWRRAPARHGCRRGTGSTAQSYRPSSRPSFWNPFPSLAKSVME